MAFNVRVKGSFYKSISEHNELKQFFGRNNTDNQMHMRPPPETPLAGWNTC